MQRIVTRGVHQIAAKGFNLQTDAYTKTRPGYPDDAILEIGYKILSRRQMLGDTSTTLKLVDFACGTGKLTEALVRALPWSSIKYSKTVIRGVEPVENMRASFLHWVETHAAGSLMRNI